MTKSGLQTSGDAVDCYYTWAELSWIMVLTIGDLRNLCDNDLRFAATVVESAVDANCEAEAFDLMDGGPGLAVAQLYI